MSMIMADKIIRLRKKNGWSQEELAEKTGVSRQAVSKWESAQTVPDLSKILLLSELFGVTTDYLLKDEIEDGEFTLTSASSSVKKVSMTEANDFLEWRREAAKKIAAATFLCILSPIPLLILGAGTTVPAAGISEKFAGCVGLSILLIMVAIASAVFVFVGQKNTPYEFLDKEDFETEYGVRGMVGNREKEFRPAYTKYNIIGTVLCVLSPVILFAGAFSENELLLTVLLSLTMLTAGIGVVFFILGGVTQASFKKLLAEGEFCSESKKMNKVKERVGSIYWLAVTAVYLALSFIFDMWGRSWIVWPVAGVLFALVMLICDLVVNKDKE